MNATRTCIGVSHSVAAMEQPSVSAASGRVLVPIPTISSTYCCLRARNFNGGYGPGKSNSRVTPSKLQINSAK
jgi:hypothetical protein